MSTYKLTARGVVAGEWTKFWSLRSSWITTAVSVVLLVAIGLIAAASFSSDAGGSGGGPGGGPAAGVSDATGLALAGTTFASLAVGVLGVLLSAGEYTTGMIRATLTAVPSRLPVLWSKSLLAGGIAFVVMTLGSIVSFLVGAPFIDDATRLGLGDDGVLRVLLLSGVYLGLVAVLGVALGSLVRSSAGGIAILAGLLLIVPGLMMLLPDSWSETLTPYLPSNGGSAMMALQTADGQFTPGQGLAVVGAWVAVLLVAAAWRLKRADA